MLEITVVGDKEVVAQLDAMPAKLHDALLAAITGLTQQVRSHVIQDKLSGQVLNHITGRLQGSIGVSTDDAPDTITGHVFSANCNYAAIHEYGFQGTEVVREHIRTHLFGKEVAPFTVGSFTRTMNMPERSFMRSSLKDFEGKIVQDISAAVDKAIA